MKTYLLIITGGDSALEVMKEITAIHAVRAVNLVSGVYDVIVDLEDAHQPRIVESINMIKKVHNVRSVLVLHTVES